jgi:signal peptidase I
MKNTKQKRLEVPTAEQLRGELNRVRYKNRFRSTLRSTIFTLVVVAAIAILVATIWLPVLQIYGASMSPTLQNGDIVVSVKTTDFQTGDMLAFYYNNKILVKRVIAGPIDWVDIDADGITYVNGEALNEPYVVDQSYGDTNIELPYQVPDGKLFVMGDHRSTSVDSRNTAVGCVGQEQIVGKIVFRVWPLSDIGLLQ